MPPSPWVAARATPAVGDYSRFSPITMASDFTVMALSVVEGTAQQADTLRQAADASFRMSAEERDAFMRLKEKWVAAAAGRWGCGGRGGGARDGSL